MARRMECWRKLEAEGLADKDSDLWRQIQRDETLLEKKRARSRRENMTAKQIEGARASTRKYGRKIVREAWAEGTTTYQKTITDKKRHAHAEKMRSWRAANPERSRANGRVSTQRYRDRRGPRAAIDTYAYKALRIALVAADAKSKYFPGYTGAEFKAHISALLPDGWTFADYGSKWELDHIVPRSAFVYSSIDDLEYKKCWALSNLRPLCKYENRRKGGIKGHEQRLR